MCVRVLQARKKAKAEKDALNEIYGFAIVDGYREKVANYKVEPPGLFRGRGAHPKTGTLKKRIRPEDVTINIGKGVRIPKAPEGHKWKGIIHNQQVTWLAYYNDTFGDFKYIWLVTPLPSDASCMREREKGKERNAEHIQLLRSSSKLRR